MFCRLCKATIPASSNRLGVKPQPAQVPAGDLVLRQIVELEQCRQQLADFLTLEHPEPVQDAPELQQTISEVAFLRVMLALHIRPPVTEGDFQSAFFPFAGSCIMHGHDEPAEALGALQDLSSMP